MVTEDAFECIEEGRDVDDNDDLEWRLLRLAEVLVVTDDSDVASELSTGELGGRRFLIERFRSLFSTSCEMAYLAPLSVRSSPNPAASREW